jgi:hypothetical protein
LCIAKNYEKRKPSILDNSYEKRGGGGGEEAKNGGIKCILFPRTIITKSGHNLSSSFLARCREGGKINGFPSSS